MLCANLGAKCELNDSPREIGLKAKADIELIYTQLAKAEGENDELKARDQFSWVRAINTCRARDEEIVIREIVLAYPISLSEAVITS